MHPSDTDFAIFMHLQSVKEAKMRNKTVEELIPKAIKYINDNFHKFKHSEKDGIDKVYSGYLNAFGPTVTTAGLNRTVAFFEDDEKKKKKKITDMLFSLLKEEGTIPENAKNLLDFINQNENYKSFLIKNKILAAAIACKLAIKTFKLEE